MASDSSNSNSNLLKRTKSRRETTIMEELNCFRDKNEKPRSLPNNWPHPTDLDLEDRPQRLINVGKEQDFFFSNNFVKTSKYEVYNFLPKFLMEEFNPKTKIANCYFLLISMLQCVPPISNTGGYPTTLIPLLFVVMVDGCFQILEDIARHRADREANSTQALVFNRESKSFVSKQWFEIEVGDIIRINSREQIPADVIIVGTHEKTDQAQGLCFVETKSLDGETNLKIKQTMPQTIGKVVESTDFSSWTGSVEMEHPNKIISNFTGILSITSPNVNGREVVSANNILLRGCVLRNTDWVFGLVVNSGHDTKIMMSNTETKPKSSFLETSASREISRIIFLLFLVCFTGATGQAIWNYDNQIRSFWYLKCPNPNSAAGEGTDTCNGFEGWIIQFFWDFLLHASFIPVSLYVSMSVARFFQAYFMNKDLEMYYEERDTPALVRTMTLNEELGQISHIFSDKTGTLTCNIMDFRKFSVQGVSYGVGITEIGKASMKLRGLTISEEVLEGDRKARENSVPHVSFYCPTYERDLQNMSKKVNIQLFMRALAICHDVIPERIDGKIKLSASNPDDEALVCAAAYFGFSFSDRRDSITMIENKESKEKEEVDTLISIEFSSKRKRMSVIVRDTDKKIRLYSKGADTMMLPRLKSGQEDIVKKTMEHMDQYSEEGLRCLLICSADLNEAHFNAWLAEYKIASTNMVELEKKKKGLDNKIEELENKIEQGLNLLGCTAIEDRLQDGVPECIEKLVQADLNIWVLTGDKQETAINIAVACNLIQPTEYMDQIIINEKEASNVTEFRALFAKHLDKLNKDVEMMGPKAKPRALIINGPCLIDIMKDVEPNGCKDRLLELSKRCKAVVGCRVSPDQKREMVALIKYGIPGVRTLAIGDGANDVAMIQEAHIGVGIRGEEGVQAVNSSDYAIAQFRYLQVLVLKHGRYNYIRMTYLICFMFYKNIMLSLGHFWMNFIDGWSGSKYFTEGAIQMFNLLYTAWPILLIGIYDMDISVKSVYKTPQIYTATKNNEYFTTWVFWSWVLTGVCESVFCAVLPLYTLINSSRNEGTDASFYMPGALCFTVIVLILNFKIYFIQSQFYWVHHVVIFLSIMMWICSAFLINYVIFFDWNWFHLFNELCNSGSFWLTIILILTAVLGKDLLFCSYKRWFLPQPYHIIQELESIPIELSTDTTKASFSVELADRSVLTNKNAQSSSSDA